MSIEKGSNFEPENNKPVNRLESLEGIERTAKSPKEIFEKEMAKDEPESEIKLSPERKKELGKAFKKYHAEKN